MTLISSCKVSFTGASIPPDAKTVSVSFFQNNAPLIQPTLSQAFTEDLRDIMISQTTLSLIPNNGDLSFEGTITDYRVSPVAIQADVATSNRLSITVNVIFTNQKDPTKDFDSNFTRFVDFPSSQNLTSIEAELIRQINQQLIQDIFNKAVINW
jgi:hypothetical protein